MEVKIIIEAGPKEIADVVVALQGQPQAPLENYITAVDLTKTDIKSVAEAMWQLERRQA